MIGFSLSQYRINAELGRGGMGIVFRALDTKLDREVALKVLPAAALASQEDRARFYREAKAAAALNHPHIAAIHQIDEAIAVDENGNQFEASDGPRPFIAMEYIEGGTLEDHIKAGPMKLNEAVRIATQVAEALKAAHAKEIVHRDIKSANIMLTKDGQAKVLDFGLAQTNASTKLTRMGSTLGTIAYMSPEQARGEAVDGRSDLYSLGTVLYEMVAGRLPFGGDYEQAVVFSILNTDPEPLTALRTGVPMELESVVKKALRKEADLRYQSAADMVADLTSLKLTSGSSTRPATVAVPHTSRSSSPRISMVALVVVGIAALFSGVLLNAVFSGGGSADNEPFDIALSLPGLDAKITREPANASDLLALSPDGRKVAYMGVAPEEGLFVKDLTTGEPSRKISDRGETPTFSPDSKFVAFASGGILYRAGLRGDAPERVADGVTDIVGLHWAHDGFLYYAADYATGISRVRAEGGNVETVISPDLEAGEIGFVYPEMLPDGETILFTAYSRAGYELRMLDVPSGQIHNLSFGVTAHFIEPDIVIFAQGPRLLAARLDVGEARLGPPVVISEAIYHNLASFSTNIGVSQNGDVLFIDGASTWNVPLEIRRWDGSRETVAPDVPDITQYVFSRDGRFIAMAGQEPVSDPDIWLYDLETRDTRQITDDPLYDAQPMFSRDGSSIWFSSERDGSSDIFSIDLLSGEVTSVYRDSSPKYVSSVFPDNSYLLFQSSRNLWALDLEGENGAQLIMEGLFDERETDVSPNSRWIAYSSDQNGQADIFVIDFPSTRPRQRITVGGGQAPKWSGDGRYLFYKKGTELYRVEMNATGGRNGDPVRIMEEIYDRFELLPDDSGILVRAKSPQRSVRYIQDAVSRIQARLDAQ